MDDELLTQIKNRLARDYHPLMIYLFGSATDPARYNPQTSDIDLLLIKQTQLPFRKRYAEARSTLRDFPVPFDLLIYTPDEFERLRHDPYSIVQEAVTKGIRLA